MKKIIYFLTLLFLTIGIYFISSCSTFSTSTTIVVDSADIHGIRYDKDFKVDGDKFKHI